jgi:peptidyl-prolyl cis-trans isomerase D
MLQKMRDNLQGWGAKIVLGLVIVTLALFGFGAFDFFSTRDPVVASVSGQDITQSQLANEIERQRQRIAAQLGPNADLDMIDGARLREPVLDQLVNRALLVRTADRMGLTVSDAQIDRAIVASPEFQVDGRFERDRFRRVLGAMGYTPTSFRAELANDHRLRQLSAGVTNSDFVTEAEARTLARLLTQTRDIAYLKFAPEAFTARVDVTEEEVRAHYETNADAYVTTETVDVSYVALRLEDLAESPDITVTEEQIQARYEADRAEFTGGDQRRTAHILLEVGPDRDEDTARETLRAARERILAGEAFEAVAKELSEDAGSAATGGDLGFMSRGTLVPEYEAVAWSLAPGEVSEPVSTAFGVHLIKLLEVRFEEFPALEARRAEIVASLRRSAAEEIYVERVGELDQFAFEVPDSLDPVAARFGLEVVQVEGLERDSGSGVFADSRLRAAAFSDEVLDKGFNSRAIDSGSVAVVLRVDRHHPAERRPFEAVAAGIREELVREQAEVLAREAAMQALDRLLAGEGTAAVAQAAGLEWTVLEKSRRTAAGVDPAILRAAFDLPRPTASARSARSVDVAPSGVAVVIVSAVYDGDYAAMSDAERAQLRLQWSQSVGNLEFAALFESAREAASIKRR